MLQGPVPLDLMADCRFDRLTVLRAAVCFTGLPRLFLAGWKRHASDRPLRPAALPSRVRGLRSCRIYAVGPNTSFAPEDLAWFERLTLPMSLQHLADGWE